MTDPGDTMIMSAGSTTPLVLELQDENGDPLDVSAVDVATLRIAEDAEDATTEVLAFSTGGGDLAIHQGTDADDDPTTLTATVAQADADALEPGVYIGQAALRFGSATTWRRTLLFKLRVLPALAGTS